VDWLWLPNIVLAYQEKKPGKIDEYSGVDIRKDRVEKRGCKIIPTLYQVTV